jgi:PIN domain nuclease of toxin-antitoxin system
VNRIVLDASALLVVLNGEPGADKLPPRLLQDATSSTVNLAEVQSKLVNRGIDADDAWEAKIAGSLVAQTRTLGLSLGDRACLALGITLKAPVYTADRSWKDLKLGIRIQVLR